MTKTTKTYLQEMCDELEPIEDKMTIKKIDLQEIKFGFDVRGDWSYPSDDDSESVEDWESLCDDAMRKAQKYCPLLHWGEGNTIESVITYPMWQIVKVESALVSHGDLIFNLWGDDNQWDVDTLDNVQDVIVDALEEKLINENMALIVNGYGISFNPFWDEWQIDHDDIGANIANFKNLFDAIEFAQKG